jgi:hypothetical protein
MSHFSRMDGFRLIQLDHSLPVPASGLQMLINCPTFGSVQFGRLFMGRLQDPVWGPTRRPARRPVGTILATPLIGSFGCDINGVPTRIPRGSLVVMPPGTHAPITCIDEPTVFAVLETSPEGRPHRDNRFAVAGLPAGTRPSPRRHQSHQLLWLREAEGVNSAIHRIFGGDATYYGGRITGYTLMINLAGEFEVTIIKDGRRATRQLRPGGRVGFSSEYSYRLRNITPGHEPASVLQFSFYAR